jgi:hypothetical protein
MPASTIDAATAIPAARDVVYSYVDKGIFRQLKETKDLPEGVAEYRFSWLSEHERIVLVLDANEAHVTFRGLLPPMPERVASFVERFVDERGPEGSGPDHRKVDPELGKLFLEQDEAGRTSLGLTVLDGRMADATRKLVNLANELIFSLQMRHADFTYEHFATIDE